MSNILVYVRPWNDEQFKDIANSVWPSSKHIQISEHKLFDKSGFVDAFYSAYSQACNDTGIINYLPFVQEEIDDIAIRCRLLRSLQIGVARRLIFSAFYGVSRAIDTYSPEYVLSVTVDSYIIDVLSKVAKLRGVKFIGLVPTFIDGYFRITERGEKAVDRDVSSDEIDKVISMLQDKNYKPQWLAANKKEIRKKAIRMWARNLIKPAWFFFYSRLKNDRLNAHYMTTDIVSRRYLSFFPQLYNQFDNVVAIRDVISADGRTPIFLPLQMSPEATIDYWSSETSWIDYEEKILSVVKEHQDRYVFIVKEHPNVLGFRRPGFYNKLLAIENLVLVNPEVSSNELLEICAAVLVCTGTVGFEALLRNKPVISTSDPFYASSNEFLSLGSELNQTLGNDPRELVEYLISGCSPGVFINNGSWDKRKHRDHCFNGLVSQSLREYLDDQ
jgi:hypothetical protein